MMKTDVYVVSWIGEYENEVLGVYTSLEEAKKKLTSIMKHCEVKYKHSDNMFFCDAEKAFYCIDEAILHS